MLYLLLFLLLDHVSEKVHNLLKKIIKFLNNSKLLLYIISIIEKVRKLTTLSKYNGKIKGIKV